MRLHLEPIGLRAANEYIDAVHRHHGPVMGHKFSVAVADEDGEIHGVGIAGRPKSRKLQEQGFIEIVRVGTDGTPNVPSMLYGALRRAALALGYPAERIVTYTLEWEIGASLRAAGFREDGVTAGGSWNRETRERIDVSPIEKKRRWRAA